MISNSVAINNPSFSGIQNNTPQPAKPITNSGLQQDTCTFSNKNSKKKTLTLVGLGTLALGVILIAVSIIKHKCVKIDPQFKTIFGEIKDLEG